jgi:hypothetical protein
MPKAWIIAFSLTPLPISQWERGWGEGEKRFGNS